MRKLNYFYKSIVAIFLILSVAGCAEWHADKSFGQGTDDTVLATKVRTALIADKNVSFKDLDVHVDNGKVQLSGFVNTPQQAHAATLRASKVKGVKAVYNDLRVRHPQKIIKNKQ